MARKIQEKRISRLELQMYKTSFKQKIALIIFGLFLSTVLLEIGLRIGGFIFLSLQEHRNAIAIRQRGTYIIMCLGESTTSLGGEDSYPRQLEEILNQSNIGVKFSVINKGVPAINTTGVLALLENNLNNYKPNLLTTMMGINDAWEEGSMPYKNACSIENIAQVFESLRVYKLTKLIWLHAVATINAYAKSSIGILTDKPKNRSVTYLVAGNSVYDTDGLKFNGIEKWIRVGLHYQHRGDYAQAEKMFKKAMAIDPQCDIVYSALANSYSEQCQYVLADEMFKKAIALNANNSDTYIAFGFSCREQEKFDEAEKLFRKAIELNPDAYAAYKGLGWYYKDHADYQQAEMIFKKAVALKPVDCDANTELASCYILQNKFSEAEVVLKKAIELDSGQDAFYGAFAAVYSAVGKYNAMEDFLRAANNLRLNYYNPRTLHNYRKLKAILDKWNIKLACIQYPMRSTKPLMKIFEGEEGRVIFVDNERVFKEALKQSKYEEYFRDNFGGDFGHCTPKGNKLLAENIANTILREVFHKQ
jgi:Tfp pilus assembly protein PilF